MNWTPVDLRHKLEPVWAGRVGFEVHRLVLQGQAQARPTASGHGIRRCAAPRIWQWITSSSGPDQLGSGERRKPRSRCRSAAGSLALKVMVLAGTGKSSSRSRARASLCTMAQSKACCWPKRRARCRGNRGWPAAQVVGRQIEQHGHRRPEQPDRFQLKRVHLQDEKIKVFGLVHRSADRGARCPHRMVLLFADARALDQFASGALAVGPGDGEAAASIGLSKPTPTRSPTADGARGTLATSGDRGGTAGLSTTRLKSRSGASVSTVNDLGSLRTQPFRSCTSARSALSTPTTRAPWRRSSSQAATPRPPRPRTRIGPRRRVSDSPVPVH